MRRLCEGEQRKRKPGPGSIGDSRTGYKAYPCRGKENLPGGSAVGLQRYEKNSAAVCRIGDSGQDRKEGLRNGAFSFFTVFRFSC